ncbi:MAG: type II toxin-antitoxin system PemK/MazF family toxin [Actinomycetota bacterium]
MEPQGVSRRGILVKRGEVWWGIAEGKRRPYVILTRDAVMPLLSRVVVVPATTTVRDIPTEVRLDRSDGMPQPCVVNLDQILTLPKASLRKRITTLGERRLDEICRALAYAVTC